MLFDVGLEEVAAAKVDAEAGVWNVKCLGAAAQRALAGRLRSSSLHHRKLCGPGRGVHRPSSALGPRLGADDYHAARSDLTP